MTKFLISIIFICLFVSSSIARQAKHVVLISIDGLRPDFYLDRSWHTPNLRKLMQQGVYSEGVNSIFPSVTYPSHTTIITGAYPATHGVFFNAPFGAEKGQWYWEEKFIRTTTLWDAVKTAGLKSGAVMWPVTVGAPIDYNFPVKRPDNDDKTDQLNVTTPVVTPANLLNDMQKSIGTLSQNDFNANHSVDRTIGKMANYIIRTYKPNLMAIHFITIDHLQHDHGRSATLVRNAVTMVDSLVGSVINTVEKAGLLSSTAFIITGDHGMVDTKAVFSPNVFLAQNGLITSEEWKAKFNTAGGSAFLYLKDKNDTETLNKVKNILVSLPDSLRNLFRIVDRKELDAIGADPDAAMAIAMLKGGAVGASAEGPVMRLVKAARGNHGYFPDFKEIQTGFIAAGAGINKGGKIEGMGIKDVAPIISHLLQLNFQAKDGVLNLKIVN